MFSSNKQYEVLPHVHPDLNWYDNGWMVWGAGTCRSYRSGVIIPASKTGATGSNKFKGWVSKPVSLTKYCTFSRFLIRTHLWYRKTQFTEQKHQINPTKLKLSYKDDKNFLLERFSNFYKIDHMLYGKAQIVFSCWNLNKGLKD